MKNVYIVKWDCNDGYLYTSVVNSPLTPVSRKDEMNRVEQWCLKNIRGCVKVKSIMGPVKTFDM